MILEELPAIHITAWTVANTAVIRTETPETVHTMAITESTDPLVRVQADTQAGQPPIGNQERAGQTAADDLRFIFSGAVVTIDS